MGACSKCGYVMDPFDTECVRCRNLAKQAAEAMPPPTPTYPNSPPSYAGDYGARSRTRANNSGRDELPPPEVLGMGFS